MTGLFGGTFDPFHLAHRALVEHAFSGLGLDQLIVMPVGRPPHKERRTSFAAYRFEMACLGVEGLADVRVSDQEIRKPGVDYTYHTVLDLKKEYQLKELVLLAGSDVLLSIDTWYRPADLLREVQLAVAVRGGADRTRVMDRARAVGSRYGTEVTLFDMPPMEISSSGIRQRVASGRAIDGWSPPSVVRFIEQYRPYDPAGPGNQLSHTDWNDLLAIEEAAWPSLSRGRRLHSASVAQYAGRLAAVYGEDIKMAATAGLLHDLAKELPRNRQAALAARYFEAIGGGGPADCLEEDLLHGPASAVLAAGLTAGGNGELARAIAWHSTAHPDLSVLGEILFLADKIAYDRTFDRLGEIRRLAEGGKLDAAMKRCLEEVFSALDREGKPPHQSSVDAYKKYAKAE